VRGYRAPSFSINRNNWWAVEELENAGYVYSSSIYPVKHDHTACRMRRAPNRPNGESGILELPADHVSAAGAQPAAAAAAGSACFHTRCRAGCCGASMRRTRRPACSISIPGDDPEQPPEPRISRRRASAITSICNVCPQNAAIADDFEWTASIACSSLKNEQGKSHRRRGASPRYRASARMVPQSGRGRPPTCVFRRRP